MLFFVGIALLIAGSVYVGNYNSPDSVDLGRKLVKAGNVVLAAMLGALIILQAYIWKKRTGISSSSMTVSSSFHNTEFLQAILVTNPAIDPQRDSFCDAVFDRAHRLCAIISICGQYQMEQPLWVCCSFCMHAIAYGIRCGWNLYKCWDCDSTSSEK